MTLALEQAESLFPGWMRSCLSCLSPGEDSQNDRQVEGTGVQREMQVCHTQPHLVPPMKLVVYDDLPSQSIHQSRHSISSWILDGKDLASRASHRASMSMSWKRHTATPLKISGPSDFRRVQSFHPGDFPKEHSSTGYRPLQLSIHQSGNRLPALPSFESFQLHEDRHRQTVTLPPPTLSPTGIRARRSQSTADGFTVARKPVGSGIRRSLGDVEHVIQRPQAVRIASSLIPYFSTVTPVEIALPGNYASVPVHVSSESEETDFTFATEWPGHPSTPEPPRHTLPQTPPARMDFEDEKTDSEAVDQPLMTGLLYSRNSPSTLSSRTLPSQISSLRRPSLSPTDNRKTIASMPLPDRVSQWFFPSKAPRPQSVSLVGENVFDWDRTRNLSNISVGSTITTITGGAKSRKPNVSISSTFTAFTTPRSSLRGPSPTIELGLEAAGYHQSSYKSKPQRFSNSSSHSRHQALNMGVAF